MLYPVTVRSRCTALLDWKLGGVLDIGFSSCATPNYLLLMSPSISGEYWKF